MDPFEAISAFGLGSVALSIAASRGGMDPTLRGTVLGMRMASATIAAVLGMSIAFLTGRGNLWPLLVVVALGMLTAPVTMVSILPFQWHQSVHKRIAVPFFVGAVRLATAYMAFWLLRRPLGYQLSVLASLIGSAMINLWWAHRVYPGRLRFDGSLARHLFSIGWPAGVLEFVVVLYFRASYFLLHDTGPVAQGQFAAADRMLKPILAISGAVFLSSMPTVAAMVAKRDHASLKTSYQRGLMTVAAGVMPVLVAAWFLSAWLLHRFAPDYSDAVWPFRILAMGAYFMFFNMMSTTYIMALGKFRIMMTITILDLFLYLLLATRLIPTYGATGAAISTSFMESMNALMQIGVVFYLIRSMKKESVRQEVPV
jgi:O-antigen/teichoic acid export membrane protein